MMAGEKIRSVDILESLSPAEKEVLTLLAQGHTAKTIATDLGISLAAVNERLRSARRRAGAGSSRELARRLAQKNRLEFTGLAPVPPEALNPTGPASSRRRLTRRNIMISSAALAIAAIIGLATQSDDQTLTRSGPDQDIVSRASEGQSPAEWRQQLLEQDRDEAWASSTEAELRELYGAAPAVSRAVESLSVTCGSSLCEVIGRTGSEATNEDVFAVVEGVQSGDLSEATGRLGLTTRLSAFTSDPAMTTGTAFLVYLERDD